MNKIRTLLSSSPATIAFLIVAIIVRIINILYVSYAGRDKMFLILQSRSMIEGKGLGVPGYYIANPDVAVYDYTPMWPPGYPIVLAPFLKLFKYDVYWSTTVLDIIACIALIFVVRRLCKQMNFPLIAINLMTLIAGCFEYPFINDSKPTDNVPIVVFLFGISLLIKIVQSEKFTFSSIILVSFILFLPSIFRYSYPPLSIAAAFSVLFIGFVKKEKLLKQKGAWLLLFVILMNFFFSLTMKLSTGYAGYAVPTARGFFPDHLIHWFPIVPASFMNVPFLTSQALKVAGLSLETTLRLLEIINVTVIFCFVALCLYLFFNKKFLMSLDAFKWFLITGFFISAATFASLGYLSATYDLQRSLTNTWSYVYDHRYYVHTVLFIQMTFLGWLFLYGNTIRRWLMKFLAAGFSFVLFIEITHNIYFHVKVAFDFKKYKSAVYRERDYAYFFNLVKELEKNYPDYDLWAAAPGDDFYSYVATYYGHIGIMDAASLTTKEINVKKKTVIGLMLYDHEQSAFENYLRSHNALFVKRVDNSNFYLIELSPGK